ncbi:MAG: hypothetical protein J0H57_08075, partial [Rhodospirillales bacterium]|nr:hypothetical protein [Rhodospirillales bacterium]
MVALPLAAKAQPVTGLYVGAGAGVNLLQDEDIKSVSSPGLGTANLGGASAKSHVGPVVVLSAGWGFGNGLRAEVEGSYRYNPFSGLSNAGNTTVTNFGGNEQKFGAMVNVLYDFYGLVPAVVPDFLLGLRVAVPLGIIITLLVEMLTSLPGIGSLIVISQRQFRSADVYGLLVVVGLMGFLINSLFAMA